MNLTLVRADHAPVLAPAPGEAALCIEKYDPLGPTHILPPPNYCMAQTDGRIKLQFPSNKAFYGHLPRAHYEVESDRRYIGMLGFAVGSHVPPPTSPGGLSAPCLRPSTRSRMLPSRSFSSVREPRILPAAVFPLELWAKKDQLNPFWRTDQDRVIAGEYLAKVSPPRAIPQAWKASPRRRVSQ